MDELDHAFWKAAPFVHYLRGQPEMTWDAREAAKRLSRPVLEYSDPPKEDGTFTLNALPLPRSSAPIVDGRLKAAAELGALVERLFCGLSGEGRPYGVRTHPARCTIPDSILSVRNLFVARRHLVGRLFYGPYLLLVGKTERRQDEDHVREFTKKVEGVQDVVFTPAFGREEWAMVQLTQDVIRIVLIQVATEEAERMTCVVVPQIREDYHGNTGIAGAV